MQVGARTRLVPGVSASHGATPQGAFLPHRSAFPVLQDLVEVRSSLAPPLRPCAQLAAQDVAFSASWGVVERHSIKPSQRLIAAAQGQQSLDFQHGALAGQGAMREQGRVSGQDVERGYWIVVGA